MLGALVCRADRVNEPVGGGGRDEHGESVSLLESLVSGRLEDHTDTDLDHPVYHDRSYCPNGREITRNGNDKPGTDGRRRCDWCSQHAAQSSMLGN